MTHFTQPKCATKNIGAAILMGAIALATNTSIANSHAKTLEHHDQIVETIENGNLNQLKQLLSNGLAVNQDLGNDGTPLIIAVQNGNQLAVEYFLQQGADVNLKSETDGTALITAALHNNLALVKYLHQHGAEIDAITQHAETALISASRAGHFEIVKYLVEHGADVNLAVEVKLATEKVLRSPLNGAKTERIRQFLVINGAIS